MEHIGDLLTIDDFVMVDNPDTNGMRPADDILDDISGAVDDLSSDLRSISLSIHDQPELQYKEVHAHKILTENLGQQHGWRVIPSAYEIKTAFVASYDSGKEGPVVSFNAEYGALQSCI